MGAEAALPDLSGEPTQDIGMMDRGKDDRQVGRLAAETLGHAIEDFKASGP